MLSLLMLLLGLGLGGAMAWLWTKGQLEAERAALAARLQAREGQLAEAQAELRRREAHLAGLQAECAARASRAAGLEAQLQAERARGGEKLAALEQSFRALSAEALARNNQSFLELARTALEGYQGHAESELEHRQQAIGALLGPVAESLARVDERLGDLERERVGAYAALHEQARALLESQHALRAETHNLAKALRAPAARGSWGELQLKRVVELAGMVAHCDFSEQVTVEAEEGRQRPDLVVHLPAGKSVVVDAKAPLSAYLEAVDAGDEATRLLKLREHARQVRGHLQALSQKRYWDQFQPAPEFVVLFLPSETLFSAALEQDPGLIEAGINQGVVLATPTTLIALLRAVAYGWRQEQVAENAREISELGRELHKRLADLGRHLGRVGRSLAGAVDSYNAAVGNLEARVLVSARRFGELGAGASDVQISHLHPLEAAVRPLQAPEVAPAAANEE